MTGWYVFWYIFCGFLAVLGLVGLIMKLYDIHKDSRKELLDEMFDNDDISAEVYKKYKND